MAASLAAPDPIVRRYRNGLFRRERFAPGEGKIIRETRWPQSELGGYFSSLEIKVVRIAGGRALSCCRRLNALALRSSCSRPH